MAMTAQAHSDPVRARQRTFVGDQCGLSSLEYALLFIVICVGALVLWSKLGESMVCQMDAGADAFNHALGGVAHEIPGLCQQAQTGTGVPGLYQKPPGGPSDPKPGNSSGSGTPKPAAASPIVEPSTLPATPADAPARVALPPQLNTAMQTSYKNSFPGGKSQERGGTIVKDDHGNIKVVNEQSGTGGTYSANRNVAANETIIGTYHTHPYDKTEGGYQGVSFSGADIANSVYYKEPKYVDAGSKQFMLVPTQQTTGTSSEITRSWNSEYATLLKSGKSIQDASSGATKAVAKKFNLAYYEGTNGTLTRVSP
jgi:hypothetical protein